MAIFGKKPNIKKKSETTSEAAPHESSSVRHGSASAKKHTGAVLFSPRVTEKSAYVSEKGVYTFTVSKKANKREIAEAIQSVYNVTPVRVRVLSIKGKRRVSRATNKEGFSASGKKAYVYLKKGDKIDLL